MNTLRRLTNKKSSKKLWIMNTKKRFSAILNKDKKKYIHSDLFVFERKKLVNS